MAGGQVARREQLGDVGVCGMVGVGVDTAQVGAQRGQSAPPPQPVQRHGVAGESQRAHHAEQRVGQGNRQSFGEGQIGHLVVLPHIRAPVGVDECHIGHPGQARADRQRQPEVAHHHVRPYLLEQAQVVVDVPRQRRLAVDRLAFRQSLQELGAGNAVDAPAREGAVLEAKVVSVGAGEMDVDTLRIEHLRQGERPADMRQRDSLCNKKNLLSFHNRHLRVSRLYVRIWQPANMTEGIESPTGAQRCASRRHLRVVLWHGAARCVARHRP